MLSTGVILGGGTHSPHFLNLGLCTPTFKRYKRPSFELKLRRNAWAAGALPQTPLGDLTALPRPPSSIKGPTSKGEGRWKLGGKGRGSGTPTFWESYAPHVRRLLSNYVNVCYVSNNTVGDANVKRH